MQAPFRAGESFAFPPSGKQPKAFTVDVFQKVRYVQGSGLCPFGPIQYEVSPSYYDCFTGRLLGG